MKNTLQTTRKLPVITPEMLRMARKLHHHSQEDTAAHMGVSIVSISRWERGQTEPMGLFKFAIAEYIQEVL